GSCGQIWPPQAAPAMPRQVAEDALIREGLGRLRSRGARFVQCLLPAEDAPLAPALARNGFQKTTSLLLLRHTRLPGARGPGDACSPTDLAFATYDETIAVRFAATLLRTYEGTLDFPELNGVRTAAEILDGHKAHGIFNSANWFLAFAGSVPVGLLLLT